MLSDSLGAAVGGSVQTIGTLANKAVSTLIGSLGGTPKK